MPTPLWDFLAKEANEENESDMGGDGEGAFSQSVINANNADAAAFDAREDWLYARKLKRAAIPRTEGAVKAALKREAREVAAEQAKFARQAEAKQNCFDALESRQIPEERDFANANFGYTDGSQKFWLAVKSLCDSRLETIRESLPDMDIVSLTGYYSTGVYDKTQSRCQVTLPEHIKDDVRVAVKVLAEASEEISHHTSRGLPRDIGRLVFSQLTAVASTPKWEKVLFSLLTTEEKQAQTALKKAEQLKAAKTKKEEPSFSCPALLMRKPKGKGKGKGGRRR